MRMIVFREKHQCFTITTIIFIHSIHIYPPYYCIYASLSSYLLTDNLFTKQTFRKSILANHNSCSSASGSSKMSPSTASSNSYFYSATSLFKATAKVNLSICNSYKFTKMHLNNRYLYPKPFFPQSGPQEFSISQQLLPSMTSQPMILTACPELNFEFLG